MKLNLDKAGNVIGSSEVSAPQQTEQRVVGGRRSRVTQVAQAHVGRPSDIQIDVPPELEDQIKDPENDLTISDLIVTSGVAEISDTALARIRDSGMGSLQADPEAPAPEQV